MLGAKQKENGGGGGRGFARIFGEIGPTNKFAYFPLIFQSFPPLQQKMPRTLPSMANCLKMEHFDNIGNNWLCHHFHPEQIDFICQCLFQWGEGERLVRMFMLNQDLLNPCVRSSTVLKAYLFALFHQGLFDTLFQVMAENRFDHSHHPELVQLWYSARYEEERKRKVKELVPVDKYRIRKKFPPPKSIWDGDELVYSFRKGDRKILKEFYERNRYPSAEDKREIGRRTGLSTTQIANWFKNRRQREKTGEPGSNY